MKKLIFTFLTIFAFVHFSHAQKIGVRAGVNFATWVSSVDAANDNRGAIVGFNFGLQTKKMLGTNWNLAPSLTWTTKGTSVGDIDAIANYIEVQIPVAYQFDFGLFLELGLAPALLLSTNDELDKDQTSSFDLGFMGGLGYAINDQFEIRTNTTIGLLNLVKDNDVFGFPDDYSENNGVWQLSLVYYFSGVGGSSSSKSTGSRKKM